MVGIFFFGLSTLFFIVKYFRFKEFKPKTEVEFLEIYNDNGIFTYTDDGFIVKTKGGDQNTLWSEVTSMVGYKEDRFTIDNICLDIFCDSDKGFKISEETSGWFMFLDHSKKQFPSIDKSWEVEIATPAFETKMTLIYDRQNRSLQEVVSSHYKS